MGTPSGCQLLVWALLALLSLQKAGKARARSTFALRGLLTCRERMAGPRPICPGEAGAPKDG